MKRLALAILSTLCACSSANKVEAVKNGSLSPGLSMSQDIHPSEIQVDSRVGDTLRVSDAQGREMLIMKAVKDENGEMVASDYLSPAVVSSGMWRKGMAKWTCASTCQCPEPWWKASGSCGCNPC